MPIRVVFDTNVVLSALIGHGAAKKSVNLARTRIIQACYCGSMLSELSEKLQKRLHYTVDDLRVVMYDIRSFGERIEITDSLKTVKLDPDDDKFVECAVVGKAEYILSEDHHLLDLESYADIKIVRPRDFLMKLRELAIIE